MKPAMIEALTTPLRMESSTIFFVSDCGNQRSRHAGIVIIPELQCCFELQLRTYIIRACSIHEDPKRSNIFICTYIIYIKNETLTHNNNPCNGYYDFRQTGEENL